MACAVSQWIETPGAPYFTRTFSCLRLSLRWKNPLCICTARICTLGRNHREEMKRIHVLHIPWTVERNHWKASPSRRNFRTSPKRPISPYANELELQPSFPVLDLERPFCRCAEQYPFSARENHSQKALNSSTKCKRCIAANPPVEFIVTIVT